MNCVSCLCKFIYSSAGARDGLKTMNRHRHDKDAEDSEEESSKTSWEDKLEDEMKRCHLKMFSLFFYLHFPPVCVCVCSQGNCQRHFQHFGFLKLKGDCTQQEAQRKNRWVESS